MKSDLQLFSASKRDAWIILIVFMFTLVCNAAELPSCTQKLKPSNFSIDERASALRKHNEYRQQVLDGQIESLPQAKEMPMLKWSSRLEAEAKRWCELCPDFEHGHPPPDWGKFPYGQCMAWGESDILGAVDAWFNEYKDPVAKGKDPFAAEFSKIGHFTQIVWAKTTELGCWKVEADWMEFKTVYCCNYSPSGNMMNEKPYETIGNSDKKKGYGHRMLNKNQGNEKLPSCSSKIDISKMTQEDKSSVLKQHNDYRQQILDGTLKGLPKAKEMPMLKWSDKLEAEAQRWSELCPNGRMPHPPHSWKKSSYGQNMATGYPSFKKAIDGWFSEHQDYTAAGKDPLMFSINHGPELPPNGHFTQMVDAKSTEIGCWKVNANGTEERVFYVCNYSPPGNMVLNGVKLPAYEKA